MITSTIKTNLILKEIGVTRYSLRPEPNQLVDKEVNFYQKGNILTLLDVPYNDISQDQKNLLGAIINAIKPKGEIEIIKTMKINKHEDISGLIDQFQAVSGIIIFYKNNFNIKTFLPIITSPSLIEILTKPNLKKPLWEDIKTKFIF
ncbi:hypothetical protein OAD86_00685 [bacterium]|jgi:hypothetical protein|nr:hypothetical protein [bacterium]